MHVDDILKRFRNVTKTGPDGWKAACPAHDDHQASLAIKQDAGKVLLHCHAGCDVADVVSRAGLTMADLFTGERPPRTFGLTALGYAQAKRLDPGQLAAWHVQDEIRISKKNKPYPTLRIEYRDQADQVTAVRRRLTMDKVDAAGEDRRFFWDKGSRISLYGLWRLPEWPKGSIIIVEGESDTHTLWTAGYHAIGLPGAATWDRCRPEAILGDYETIYVCIEPDSGGSALYHAIAGDPEKEREPSALLPKIRFFSIPGAKDPSDAWTGEVEPYRALMDAALAAAVPASEFTPPPRKKTAEQKTPGDKRAETSPANGQKGGRPTADYFGLAKAFADNWRDPSGCLTLRYWRGCWYRHDGHCYHQAMDADIEAEAMAFLQSGIAGDYNSQPSINAHRNMLQNLKSATLCALPSSLEMPFWISNGQPATGWVSMENCIVQVESLAEAIATAPFGDPASAEALGKCTYPSTPDLFSTFSLPYPFDPAAASPTFDRYMSSSQPDFETQQMILALMGLAMVPETRYNVCFFLWGPPGTGKSTFLHILQSLVGRENCCALGLLDLEDKFATWRLTENLLNLVGDLPTADPQGRLRYIEGLFKDVVSGAYIDVQKKGKDIINAKAIARHVFATNTLPFFFDKSGAINDRLRIIPFLTKFRGTDAQDPELPQKLTAEMPGIFNQALLGLYRLRQQVTFPESAAAAKAKEEHLDNCDVDAQYLKETYKASDTGCISASEAYTKYRSWLAENGFSSRNSTTFRQHVSRIFGIRETRISNTNYARVFKGLEKMPPPPSPGEIGF